MPAAQEERTASVCFENSTFENWEIFSTKRYDKYFKWNCMVIFQRSAIFGVGKLCLSIAILYAGTSSNSEIWNTHGQPLRFLLFQPFRLFYGRMKPAKREHDIALLAIPNMC